MKKLFGKVPSALFTSSILVIAGGTIYFIWSNDSVTFNKLFGTGLILMILFLISMFVYGAD